MTSPVKLYARNYVGSFGRGPFGRGNPLPKDVTVVPVAVLPNVIKAAQKGEVDVTAIADSTAVGCKVDRKDPNDSLSENSQQIKPDRLHRIPKETSVQLTGAAQVHCGDTNLIEVVVDG